MQYYNFSEWLESLPLNKQQSIQKAINELPQRIKTEYTHDIKPNR